MRQELFHELEETLQRLASDRADSLSDRALALCERKPFRCHPRGRRPLDQRLRYATQAEVAGHRFLLAYLRCFQPGHLLAELVKNLDVSDIIPP